MFEDWTPTTWLKRIGNKSLVVSQTNRGVWEWRTYERGIDFERTFEYFPSASGEAETKQYAQRKAEESIKGVS